MKRGMTHAEAMDYVGVKRRTFDEQWRPQLTPMRQGSCLVFDRQDLDALFDKFKAAAAPTPDSANEGAQNALRNGRPAHERGAHSWAKQRGASTPAKTEPGKLTSGGAAIDFATAASVAMKKRNAG